jgi:hypothetical protein
MEDGVGDLNGDDASLGKTECVHASAYIVDCIFQSSVADQTDARARRAYRSGRSLTLAMEQDRVDDIHRRSTPARN